MSLREYFEQNKGTGVLSTADNNGKVNSAIFARPHVMEDNTVAFIMADRLNLHNLQQNPHASFLFLEQGHGYQGKRLHLTKVREEQDPEAIQSLRRKSYSPEDEDKVGNLRLVHFAVDQELPLLGAGPSN